MDNCRLCDIGLNALTRYNHSLCIDCCKDNTQNAMTINFLLTLPVEDLGEYLIHSSSFYREVAKKILEKYE